MHDKELKDALISSVTQSFEKCKHYFPFIILISSCYRMLEKLSHFYLLHVSRGYTTITWNIAGELHDETFSMHSVIQCTNYRLTTFFSLQSSSQNPYTHIKTYHSYNYTNNHIIDINKLTTSCIYLCTFLYACMPPLLTKACGYAREII